MPTGIRIDFDRSVSLALAAERPDSFHEQVKVAYPADYFVTKVRVKEKDGKPDKENSGRGDDDSPGRSKGKGKGKNS